MIFTTHIGIARLVHRELKKDFNINLHLQGFIYGNIRPDLKPDYFDKARQRKIKHFVWESLDFMIDALYQLETSIKNGIDIEMQPFAIQLGHIMHYFSDYFCYAHTINYNKSLVSHLVYECVLSGYFSKSDILLQNTIKTTTIIHKSIPALLAHFKSLQNDYLNQPPSMQKDIEYTLYFVKSLCYSATLGFNTESKSISA